MIFRPLEHQKLAIGHLKATDEALLFAGMGLGKTAACLEAMDWHFANGSARGFLVVAPLRVSVLTWPDEVEKWSNFRHLTTANLRTEAGIDAWNNDKAFIYLINYESMPKFVNNHIKGKRASQLPIDSVLFDEVDNAKKPSGKRIKVFRNFARPKLIRAWGMTGTPVSNSRLDIFAQVRLIDQGKTFGDTYSPWVKQYFEPENTYSDYPKMVPRMGTAELLENSIAHMTLVLLSEDWLKIPPVVTEDIKITLPANAKKIYRTVEKELLETLQDGFEIIAVNAAALVTKLLQISSGAVYVQQGDDEETRRVEHIHDVKIKALRKLHDSLGQQPMIIATQYRHEVSRILAAFPYAATFTAETYRLWNQGKIKMLVSHPKSIGHGLNLQDGGSVVCWFSLGYSRALYDQFNARLARQGQTKKTRIYRLISPGTVDDAVAASLEGKGNDQSAFMQTLKNIKRLAER